MADRWITIDDFTPGIRSKSNHALSGVGNPAPLGSAQVANTWRCIGLPKGGLSPLPQRIATQACTLPEAATPQSGYWVIGFLAFGPQSIGTGGVSDYSENLFVAVAYQMAGTNQQRFRLFRIQMYNDPVAIDTLVSLNTAYTSATDFYEPAFFVPTRMHNTTPTDPGNPVVVYLYATPGGSAEMRIGIFPDPAAPATNALQNLSTTRWGKIMGHQGRLVLFEFISNNFGTTGGVPTDEQISFSDPPNSVSLGTQEQVVMQEWPNGFGAWGSISAGELFLVKRQGGGVMISGDIANPSVTRLPGVTSTGTYTNNPAVSTSVGFLYAVAHGGVYLWRGSDTSQKVSEALDDGFFAPTTNVIPGNAGVQTSMASWGDWMVMTNSYLLDLVNGGWWRMEDTENVVNPWFWSPSFDGRYLYGCVSKYTNSGSTIVHIYDRSTGATNFSWQSHPIPASLDRIIDVRELVLVAQGSGTVSVTLTNHAGVANVETFTVTKTTQPQRLRLPTSCQGYNIVVKLISDGGASAAPVIYSLAMRVMERAKAVDV